eukprot:TRINITY_DN35607_c0_g1_i2.p1 TRINITY_DN35607_c0_g1~~TRINITY_DN35607_c0_g1_i2.p1  ORF type:complete len:102 (+),score=7.12 TRINITY_DN35607_c0_g1_i2:38-343(+)
MEVVAVMGGTAVISDAMTVVHLDILLGNVDPRVQETHIGAAQVPVTEQAAADTTPLEVHMIIADPLDVTTRVPLREIEGATEIERNFNLQIDEATPMSILH